MAQTWESLLFAHWRLAPERLREQIPPPLEIDRFDGEAWLGITPFKLSGLRLEFTVEVEITRNTMPPPGLQLPAIQPLCHVAERQDVLIWSLDHVS